MKIILFVLRTTAKNKKDAKKLAAKAALKALYNLDYPEEMKIENPDAVVH